MNMLNDMPFLDWINKNQAKETAGNVPYHLLRHEAIYGENRENLLIQGDNLLALKALRPFYAGQVKCIFIDPPYNTQSAFEHYDDKLEHSQWLSMMYPRLVLLRDFLKEDGSIWVTIDDDEQAYLKVLMDEIFGRTNFVRNIVWQKRTSPDARLNLGDAHDYVTVYAKNWACFQSSANKLKLSEGRSSDYKNPDNDSRGPWASVDITGQTGHATDDQFYEVITPSGKKLKPPQDRCWAMSKSTFEKLVADNRIWFGKNGESRPRQKKFLSETDGMYAWSWWTNKEAGHNQEAKKEILTIFDNELSFATPKPERLIKKVLDISTNPNDLVLDSFLGSGTTAAVAHKMGRRYIGIEMGEHAKTHCVPRLEKVISGEQGGISKEVNWQGGGGFRFCTLGEPAFDADGRINRTVRFPTLAAYVWHYETGGPGQQVFNKPLLGVHNNTAYYLLYNGILGDRRPAGGNVLTHAVLQALMADFPHDGPIVIYGETSRLGSARLAAEGITFKQIPYDVKMR